MVKEKQLDCTVTWERLNKACLMARGLIITTTAFTTPAIFRTEIKEGKGSSYFIRAGKPDSVIKGYWSGNVYRGKSYVTYTVKDMPPFERVDIAPSDESGNTITIETETTSGAVKGSVNSFSNDGAVVLTVTDVVALDGSEIRKREASSGLKYSVTYELSKFPARLLVSLSTGRSFTLELYKAAKWKVSIFWNK
jgi:hypothetical protein